VSRSWKNLWYIGWLFSEGEKKVTQRVSNGATDCRWPTDGEGTEARLRSVSHKEGQKIKLWPRLSCEQKKRFEKTLVEHDTKNRRKTKKKTLEKEEKVLRKEARGIRLVSTRGGSTVVELGKNVSPRGEKGGGRGSNSLIISWSWQGGQKKRTCSPKY